MLREEKIGEINRGEVMYIKKGCFFYFWGVEFEGFVSGGIR